MARVQQRLFQARASVACMRNDLIVIGKRTVVLLLLFKGVSAVVAGASEIGIEPYRLVVVLDGAVEVALAGISETSMLKAMAFFGSYRTAWLQSCMARS
jgi:hypothetical protein